MSRPAGSCTSYWAGLVPPRHWRVMGAFAEFERSSIKERQKEGIALAKKAGVYKGRSRPSHLNRSSVSKRGQPKRRKGALAREFGISRETLYSYLAR